VKFGDKCRDDNGCRDASFCNGRGPQCPPSVNKPNKTICNKEFACFMGVRIVCLCVFIQSMGFFGTFKLNLLLNDIAGVHWLHLSGLRS
jgi:hypothetical protein